MVLIRPHCSRSYPNKNCCNALKAEKYMSNLLLAHRIYNLFQQRMWTDKVKKAGFQSSCSHMSWIIQSSHLPCTLLPAEQKSFYTLMQCAISFLCCVLWLSSPHSKQPQQLPLIYFSNLKEHSGDDVLIHTTNHTHLLNVM